jgi:hypothetical protein
VIPLDSPQWRELKHAYGPATDTPQLLRDLERFPVSDGRAEPWFTLWSSLCHQGNVYPASFAAVPHIVRVLATAPARAGFDFFLLPACIEVARSRKSVPVLQDLSAPYAEAISNLPILAGAAAVEREWDDSFLCSVLSAIAVAKGHLGVAEAVQELTPEVAEEFLEWFRNR